MIKQTIINEPKVLYPPPPEILRGKLVFGDEEQIAALRGYESVVGEIEQEVDDLKNGVKHKYHVTVEVSGSVDVEVIAAGPIEAEEIARDDFVFDNVSDIETDFYVHRMDN